MKFLESLYPMGTFKGQKTDGAYINEYLAKNLNVYAKRLKDDMHFLLIIAGNDSVGNGKSTIATHIGAYLTNKINELHGVNNTFTSKNISLNAKDLVKQSFDSPKLSVNVLDEGDDLTTHGMKQDAVELKRYFRKCRQLNQILVLIIPSFFELPKFYAMQRSHCLINVKFHDDFRRGVFDFYGPSSKKKLYIRGKREWDYNAGKPDFDGGFFSSYTFFPELEKEIELYKKKKYTDMVDDATEDGGSLSPIQIERRIVAQSMRAVKQRQPKITHKELGLMFHVADRTVFKYLNEGFGENFQIENSEFRSSRSDTIKAKEIGKNSSQPSSNTL